ncbi:hypothetical protein [Modestobacter roseus]|uniref:Uncharacterized protein n=1 Tax=Modestobacter roseus TaxID=1181884 RepID=A0A562IR58_9ACTN|nr:hypothetical protein [Modestobacter roseus]MQA34450.1 hypothetical protein [Modestobacter roseus]TWH73064.1 hypothetical protein JD78_01587 [Modestobacter roseus]
MPRWPATPAPDALGPVVLGVVVHGPVLLARSPGIAAGLRCVFAHPGGLHLPIVVRATGVQAEAAGRRTFPRRDGEPQPWSGLLVTLTVDGVTGPADPVGPTSSGGADSFRSEGSWWAGALPNDGRLTVTVGWPAAGLAEATTVLQLDPLDDVADRVVPLH